MITPTVVNFFRSLINALIELKENKPFIVFISVEIIVHFKRNEVHTSKNYFSG